jgi:hypothetical protein
MKPPIQIWKFEDAPKELQALSTNGGDEDWLAIVPDYLTDEYIGWLEEGSAYGCCCVNEYNHPTIANYKIKIGCHS